MYWFTLIDDWVTVIEWHEGYALVKVEREGVNVYNVYADASELIDEETAILA